MVLNEALRLWPTAPGFGLYAKEDTVIGGKYQIKKGDFIYREELEEYERKGIVTLHTAFSRETGKEKTYVQHLMVKDNQKIMEVLNDNNGTLYICGDGTRMAPDVEASLRQAYSSVYGKDEQAAAEWLEQLQQSGRYAKDVWAGL